MEYIWKVKSPLGKMTMASDGEQLTGLWIAGQKYYGAALSEKTVEKRLPIFEQTSLWLERYFAGKRPEIGELPLKPEGTVFRQQVWEILCEIPYGETITYGEIAKRLEKEQKKRMSAQAVGGAVGHNPISVIIPCHRVIGSDGSLTGYAGGIELKRRLLVHEGVILNTQK